MTMMIIATCL